MKWAADKCRAGDLVRSKQGAIYHFGIYVSDDEVIQFGRSPLLRKPEDTEENIEVLATDITDFACGKTVERSVFGFFEKRISPAETIQRARARIGERGYHILHNNCEHFAYECATGKRYSAQEEALREKWNTRPILDVYFSRIPEDLTIEKIYPSERTREIEICKNERVRAEKFWVWKTLLSGIEKSFGLDPGTVHFKKTASGKWTSPECFFSLTHTEGAVAVAVSNAEVGIDLESKRSFLERNASEPVRKRLAEMILAKGEQAPSTADDLLLLWTQKESAFKLRGKGHFQPKKIEIGKYSFQSMDLGDYVFTVCGKHAQEVKAYSQDGSLIKRS